MNVQINIKYSVDLDFLSFVCLSVLCHFILGELHLFKAPSSFFWRYKFFNRNSICFWKMAVIVIISELLLTMGWVEQLFDFAIVFVTFDWSYLFVNCGEIFNFIVRLWDSKQSGKWCVNWSTSVLSTREKLERDGIV